MALTQQGNGAFLYMGLSIKINSLYQPHIYAGALRLSTNGAVPTTAVAAAEHQLPPAVVHRKQLQLAHAGRQWPQQVVQPVVVRCKSRGHKRTSQN